MAEWSKNKRIKIAVAGAVLSVLALVVIFFLMSQYFRVPRLFADKPEDAKSYWRLRLDTSTRGGVDVYSYRVRLKTAPMPARLREAQIPETGPFRLNGVELEKNQWVEIALDPALHVDQHDGAYLPVDLRHQLFDGPATFDLEIDYGIAEQRKSLTLNGLRVKARTDF